MQNAAQYRVFAEECRELARKAKGENKEKLLRIADAWDRCAKDIENARNKGAPGTVALHGD